MALRFRQLQALHAIVETGTVTAAAEALKISQPGVSNLIAQMERTVKLALFRRVKGRLIPTPEAMVLYQDIDTVVRGVDHLNQTVLDLQNKQLGQLQVATTHAVSFGLMPKLIARFCASRPNVSVSFQSQYSGKIQEWITAGLFEIGVCEAPLFSDEYRVTQMHFDTVCALPEDHPLARHDVLTPALLEDEPFIVMRPDHMTHRRTREVFQNAGLRWRPRVHTHLFRNKLGFVREGMGVALIDPFTIANEPSGGYVTRRFDPAVQLDMSVITSKRHTMSALGQGFLDLLIREMRQFESPRV